ncbi:MAG: molybdopterin-dependent oxidoreductase, partial [Betaproteobacteria bacterium]
MLSYRSTACPHDCPSVCALEVEVIDSKTIGSVRGARDNSYTAGVICAKVARYEERVHHPDRLKTPLVRVGPKGEARFAAASWDDALDVVAGAFQRASEQYGSESVWPYYYGGTMGLLQRFGIERLRHAMRYSGQKEGLCVGIARTGWLAGIGKIMGADAREIADAELVVIWGGNPVNTQINIMTHTTRARKANKARMVVIDPYRTGTAAAADMHLALRPGTDGALACAVMHVLFAEGFADQAYLEKYTDCPEAFREHLKDKTPAWAAAITGLAVDEIVTFARMYGGTRKSFIKCGYGFSRSRNGSVNFHAVTCLPAVTGAWTVKGGGASWHSSDIYHWDRTLLEGLDVRDPSIRMLQQSRIGPILNGDPADIKDGPPVKAMLIQNINPCAIAPDTNAVIRGFSRQDLFVCVHEQFMTDTARMADVVLPATTFLEHNDLYQAGGHTHIQIGAKLIESLAESRSNHSVICALGKRLGSPHPGFAMTEWEMIDSILRSSGWPDADTLLAKRWHDCAPSFEDAHFLSGFHFPGGKFRFRPDWKSLGPDAEKIPPMPDHFDVIDQSTDELPFRLVTAPARTYLNTTFTETPGSKKREGRPTVMIHQNDANGLSIADGELVRVGNARGFITLHASVVAGINLGTVIIESVWPNDAFPEGVGINALTSAEQAFPNGG